MGSLRACFAEEPQEVAMTACFYRGLEKRVEDSWSEAYKP